MIIFFFYMDAHFATYKTCFAHRTKHRVGGGGRKYRRRNVANSHTAATQSRGGRCTGADGDNNTPDGEHQFPSHQLLFDYFIMAPTSPLFLLFPLGDLANKCGVCTHKYLRGNM